MAVEAKRGCGYRKIGGLYMCAKAPNAACCAFPFRLKVCPVCNQGVKQSRNVQWFTPRPWLKECEIGKCPAKIGEKERALLIWIGAKFYATPEEFLEEAMRMGISRRIKTIPKKFKLGETKVFFAHPRVAFVGADGYPEYGPGVFSMVTPNKFEMLITENPTEKQQRKLKDTRITPVIVPGNDQDHNLHVVDDDPDFEEIWNNGNQRQAGA